MPSYNTASFIKESIESVIGQTYTNWELIIVDDCSTDNTEVVVSEFKDKRIKFFKNSKNEGAAFSRNFAIKNASGKWIAFLDSDDIWKNTKLEKQIAFMEKNDYHFSYCSYYEFENDKNNVRTVIKGPKTINKRKMSACCWIGCLTAIYDSTVAGIVQIPLFKKNNDYAIWISVIRYSKCFFLDESLAFYRKGRNNSISNISLSEKIKWQYKIYKETNKSGFFAFILTMRSIFWNVYKKIKYVKKIKGGYNDN